MRRVPPVQQAAMLVRPRSSGAAGRKRGSLSLLFAVALTGAAVWGVQPSAHDGATGNLSHVSEEQNAQAARPRVSVSAVPQEKSGDWPAWLSPVPDAPQVFTPRPKPVLVLDLGHRGRYDEGKCAPDTGSVQGNRRGGVSEADVIDALGHVLQRELSGDPRFDLVLTRAPGAELSGGCKPWRASLLSRLEPAQAAAAKGAAVTFVSLHVDESGWIAMNDLSVFMASENPASVKLAQDFAHRVRAGDAGLRTRVKPDAKNTLVLHNDAQKAVPILIEFSAVRFADRIIRPEHIDNKGRVMATALRALMYDRAKGQNGPDPSRAFGAW